MIEIPAIWKRLQDEEWEMYQKSLPGVFSENGLKGADKLGHVILRCVKPVLFRDWI